ncbi:MAG: phenylalanine--tRNA ligase subunit alpha [Desulfobacterales bacterium]|nr:MAG: phenylalanine--tRNA ligase subunit alpha [Desulfobacterales bacterium]
MTQQTDQTPLSTTESASVPDIEQIREDALSALSGLDDPDKLRALSTMYLGRKGLITRFLRDIPKLPPGQRPAAGRRANEIKAELDAAVTGKVNRIEAALRDAGDRLDVSLPGRRPSIGTLHPLTRITREICDIFARMGFDIAEGPEVETDHYNFEALNIPESHPARDMQDTFYISEKIVLRTQTSSVQIRIMEKTKPPVAIIAPGKVYRCDSDVTHTPMFSQVEGLLVDRRVSLGDLKGVLNAFARQMFGDQVETRFRPSFFPFTEPSAEMDIQCVMCRGDGCRICSRTGWLEILGCGMVHPALFEKVGYDASLSGFAFGMGIERITMLKYRIDDLRTFFDNDTRFLRQF